MTFLYPWVLLGVPALWLWVQRRKVIKKDSAIQVPAVSAWENLSSGRAKYLWILKACWWSAIVCLVISLARPQILLNKSRKDAKGIAIEILVDVSSSMDMGLELRDKSSKTRMEVAKEIVVRFILGDDDKLQGRPNDLIGLITFARYADTRSPLTTGHKALVDIVRGLEIQNRPNEDGTAYGDALALACARLEHLEELRVSNEDGSQSVPDTESRVVVLLTDGENNSGRYLPQEAAALAQKWGCRVYVISLGDVVGGSVEGRSDPPSPAEQVLRHIAESTNGIFRRAHDFESLLSVYQEIDQLERTKIRIQEYVAHAEVFWLPLMLGCMLLISMMALESTWLRVAP